MTRQWAFPALLLTAGCRSQRPLPELPVVDLANAQAAVRAVIDPALAAARAKPNDAALVARLGMALNAHNELAEIGRAHV